MRITMNTDIISISYVYANEAIIKAYLQTGSQGLNKTVFFLAIIRYHNQISNHLNFYSHGQVNMLM